MPSAKRLTYGDTFTAFDPSRKPVAECAAVASVGKAAEPPKWIKPQLTRNADGAPAGDDWLHEITTALDFASLSTFGVRATSAQPDVRVASRDSTSADNELTLSRRYLPL